jgi:DNA-binding GntR family transcriptional regulator
MEPLVNAISGRQPGEETAERRTLAERAYLALREEIVTLRLPPGSPIHEERLSQSLGTGRTPVREAVKRLAADGLVAVYPRRGTFVTEINITDHGLLAEVRRPMEAQAAAAAAQRATEAERAELAELARQCRDPAAGVGGRPEATMRLDAAVHRAIYGAAHNRYLAGTLGEYYDLTLRIWYLFLPRLTDVTEHVGEHAPLIEAILDGDPDTARALMERHVEGFEQAVFRALQP